MAQQAAARLSHPLTRVLLVLTFTTVRKLAVPELTTTVLTLTLTGLAADSRLAGGSGKGSARRTVAVLVMLVGAVCGALLLKVGLALPIAVAAALALAAAVSYGGRSRG